MLKCQNVKLGIHKILKKIRNFDFRFSIFDFASKTRSGFTMVELILVITLISLIFGMGATSLADFSTNQNLRVSGERLAQTIREARVNSVSQYRDSSWGIYFDTVAIPNKYILYKGGSYIGRDTAFDRVTELSRAVTIQNINLNGGNTQISFGKRSGFTDEYGALQLGAGENFYSISVNGLGFTDYNY